MTANANGASTFTDWCLKNSNVFWRKNRKGVVVALSDVSLPVFREIAKLMDFYHSKDKSCGDLVHQLLISKNSVRLKSRPTELSSYPHPNAQVVKDLMGFGDAVQHAVTTTLSFQSQVPPPADCFVKHFNLLKNFDQNAATLKEKSWAFAGRTTMVQEHSSDPAIPQKLSTSDRLVRWGLRIHEECGLCHSASESLSHLFFSCSFSLKLWLAVRGKNGVHYGPCGLQELSQWFVQQISNGCSRVLIVSYSAKHCLIDLL
ncbi:hypothetical protein Vadar_008498 [Vaccinium darrowii]|uniref:Uncharacterized protein n=1 Tax=Vaccinium darrowii TaxID=229202 RepID=A0ACB7XP69_9ERIC|nr:hypothetical protein Vadar_008498 [Vaccinium darrowii]